METVLNTLTRWMIVLALMLACWPFARHSRADSMAVSHWTARPVAFQKALYTARFQWNGSTYLFQLGTVARPAGDQDHSRFVAQISQGARPVAVCERQVTGETPFDANSMLLRCEGSLFAPAAAMASFRFAPKLAHPMLTLWTGPRAAGQQLALWGEPAHAAAKLRVASAK